MYVYYLLYSIRISPKVKRSVFAGNLTISRGAEGVTLPGLMGLSHWIHHENDMGKLA